MVPIEIIIIYIRIIIIKCMAISAINSQNSLQRNNPNCIRTRCPQKCCNAFGNCIDTSSDDPHVYQCRYYYNRLNQLSPPQETTLAQLIQDPIVIFCLVLVTVIGFIICKFFIKKQQRYLFFYQSQTTTKFDHQHRQRDPLRKPSSFEEMNSNKQIIQIQVQDNLRQKTKTKQVFFETRSPQKKICVSLEDGPEQKPQKSPHRKWNNLIQENPEYLSPNK